jgi:hypothetical protein
MSPFVSVYTKVRFLPQCWDVERQDWATMNVCHDQETGLNQEAHWAEYADERYDRSRTRTIRQESVTTVIETVIQTTQGAPT